MIDPAGGPDALPDRTPRGGPRPRGPPLHAAERACEGDHGQPRDAARIARAGRLGRRAAGGVTRRGDGGDRDLAGFAGGDPGRHRASPRDDRSRGDGAVGLGRAARRAQNRSSLRRLPARARDRRDQGRLARRGQGRRAQARRGHPTGGRRRDPRAARVDHRRQRQRPRGLRARGRHRRHPVPGQGRDQGRARARAADRRARGHAAAQARAPRHRVRLPRPRHPRRASADKAAEARRSRAGVHPALHAATTRATGRPRSCSAASGTDGQGLGGLEYSLDQQLTRHRRRAPAGQGRDGRADRDARHQAGPARPQRPPDARRQPPGPGRGGAQRGRQDVAAQGRDRDRDGPQQRRDPRARQLAAGERQRARGRARVRAPEPRDRRDLRARLDLQGVHRRRRAGGRQGHAGHEVQHPADPQGRRPRDQGRRGPRLRDVCRPARSSSTPRTSARC